MLLEQVKLPRPGELLDAWPHQLSGGQRQRVMIAMAIANDPELLIADEPTTALDVTVQQEILALLAELRDRHGMGMLFITHDLNLVRRHADRVCVLYAGKEQETGPVAEVFQAPRSDYTRTLLAAEPVGRPQPVADAAPLLQARQLSVSFQRPKRLFAKRPPAFEAVKPLDLTLAPGETLGIVGNPVRGRRRWRWHCCVWSKAVGRSCSTASGWTACAEMLCVRVVDAFRWCFRTPTARCLRAYRYRISSARGCGSTAPS